MIHYNMGKINLLGKVMQVTIEKIKNAVIGTGKYGIMWEYGNLTAKWKKYFLLKNARIFREVYNVLRKEY